MCFRLININWQCREWQTHSANDQKTEKERQTVQSLQQLINAWESIKWHTVKATCQYFTSIIMTDSQLWQTSSDNDQQHETDLRSSCWRTTAQTAKQSEAYLKEIHWKALQMWSRLLNQSADSRWILQDLHKWTETENSESAKTIIVLEKCSKETEKALTIIIIQKVLKQDSSIQKKRKREHTHISSNSHEDKSDSVKQFSSKTQSFWKI